MFGVQLIASIRDEMMGFAHSAFASGERVFDLVGHSRGGHVAILIAGRLTGPEFPGARVRFLGLFDAVDRSPHRETTNEIPMAVEKCAHAIRNPLTLNRTWFGNTGTTGRSGQYIEKYFWATHGAIGGDPSHARSWGGFAGPNSLLVSPTADKEGSEAAWSWMLAQSLSVGVPV